MRAVEFILESREETAALWSVSNALTKKLGLDSVQKLKLLRAKNKFLPKFTTGSLLSDLVDIDHLNRQETKVIYESLKDLLIIFINKPAGKGVLAAGAYYPNYHVMGINLAMDPIWVKANQWPSTIAHELRHAVDNVRSMGRGLDITSRDLGDFQQYITAPWEINARLEQVLQSVYELMLDFHVKSKGEPMPPAAQKILMTAATGLMKDSNLEDIFPKGKEDPSYKRLVNRVYKVVSSPVFYVEVQEQPSAIKKFADWITSILPGGK